MRIAAYFIALIFTCVACQEVQRPEPPEHLIPKEKMVQILADAYISNASRSKGVNNRILRTKGIHLDSMLYTKHKIDSLSFAQSNFYYASNLDQYTEIIIQVEELLTTKKALVDSLTRATRGKNFKKVDTTITTFQKPKTGQLAEPIQDK